MKNPSNQPRLLFICLNETTFVKDDLKLLSERYEVKCFRFDANRFAFRTGRAFGLWYYGLKQFFWLLRELPKADLVYGWFADYHLVFPVFLAKWFNVPTVAVLAGFDAIELPKMGYGVYQSRWRSPLAKWVIRNTDLLLPVSESLIFSENRYSDYPNTLKNGVKHHISDLKTSCEIVPFGFDAADWPMGRDERGVTVCTVGRINDHRTFLRKGIDLFFKTAQRLPEVSFRVIGIGKTFSNEVRERYHLPENVELVPPVPRSQLADIYGEASVYAQFSRAEGQPNVLCEAMLCGCIPVGSAIFGIPETIGDTGLIVHTPEPDELANIIQQAFAMATSAARQTARDRIINNNSTDHRRQALFRILYQFEQQVDQSCETISHPQSV